MCMGIRNSSRKGMMKGWANIITRSILTRKPKLHSQNTTMDREKMFADKSAIVTGAGQGIGYEIVRQLVLQGARVILNDQDAGMAARAVTTIREETGDARSICRALGGQPSYPRVIRTLVHSG